MIKRGICQHQLELRVLITNLTSIQSEYYYSWHDGWSKTEFKKVPITGG
jgi:hypothetical protein